MTLTVNSYSRFKLYFAEPSSLRPFYRIDLDEVHDIVSNSGFEISFHPKERKDFIKANKSRFVTGHDLAIINITNFPFKALKEYIEFQLDRYLDEQNKSCKPVRHKDSEEENLFDYYIEPRILIYRRFDEKSSERFLDKFTMELEDAFKTTFAITAFDQKELNNTLIEILNLRKKNRIVSN